MQIIGIGQPSAGNDGIGIALVEALRTLDLPGVELRTLRDPLQLIELLDGRPTVILDAVIDGSAVGTFREISYDELADNMTISSHGMGVFESLGMAMALYGSHLKNSFRLFGVSIERPPKTKIGLSHELADQIPHIVESLKKELNLA